MYEIFVFASCERPKFDPVQFSNRTPSLIVDLMAIVLILEIKMNINFL